MHLLSVNLQKSGAISVAVYGNFSGSKAHEIVCARGNGIELFRPDETGRMISINYTPCFCVVRSLLAFRLLGSNVDYLVIGTDSGKVTIVEYEVSSNSWKTLHCETFGKTGCRRIVPGQYLACDPKGRAILVAGIEKQRFVYVMNRDGNNKLTISSPLEAHRTETICFSAIGLDVGLENPVFALLELAYDEADADPSGHAASASEKKLTYYELDLGLNHVVRRWSEPVSRTANFLLAVPGGNDGPGGVLLCGENWIAYKHQGHHEIRTAIPRRDDYPQSRGLLLVSGTVHKQKGMFFFLAQSEVGDLYKVTLTMTADETQVTDVVITVFDTIQPASSLCITRNGLLFAASEHSTHYLFQFQGLGAAETAVTACCSTDETLGDDAASACTVALSFHARNNLSNLVICDQLASLSPLTDMVFGSDRIAANVASVHVNTAGSEKNMHTLCGSGYNSSLRTLRPGCSVSELAVSSLPGKPVGVWTVKKSFEDEIDSHIVVAFPASTIVLSVGETVEEVEDSGFILDNTTLAVSILSDSSRVQVHSKGVRHIRQNVGRQTGVVEWKTPDGRFVEKACANSSQVIIALQNATGHGNELIVFEIDEVGQLAELGTTKVPTAVNSLDVAPVPAGRTRSPFLAVGFLDDTVQILSLEPSGDALFSQRALMAVDARPDSLCFVSLGYGSLDAVASTRATLHLNIGLQTGVLHRVTVDSLSGSLSDSRQRFLGSRTVKLSRLDMRATGCGQGLLALSSRPWAAYLHQGRTFHSPLSYDNIDNAANFCSDACPDGIVATVGNSLRIININEVGSIFNQTSVPLPYTPRKLAVIETGDVVVVASDLHAFTSAECKKLGNTENFVKNAAIESVKIKQEEVTEMHEEDGDDESTRMAIRGPVPESPGKWASCIALIDPITGKKQLIELENNEAAFSVCVVKASQERAHSENFIVVGTAVGLQLSPRTAQKYFLVVYRFVPASCELQLLHRTAVDQLPMCLCEFNGKLLAGMGDCMRLYEIGIKQMLRKCEARGFPSSVVRIETHGNRIFVGDMAESIFAVKYKKNENSFIIFGEDVIHRWTNGLCVLDHDTCCGSDKFGNIFVLRTSENADDDVDGSGARTLWDAGGRSHFELECHYYLGDIVTSLRKAQFFPGGKEMLLAATLGGELYALQPITNKGDLNFYTDLENFLRLEISTICGRVHQSYRSYYQPVRNVIDGELCSQYVTLPFAKQLAFAEEQSRTVPDVLKKLEEMRDVL